MEKYLARSVALLTPSHCKDIERFALLCESIDRFVTGHTKHYVLVTDDCISEFSRFAGRNRVLLPGSKFLPRWLKLMPQFLRREGRRVWWSFRSGPVHGWHIQQILKIFVAAHFPENRYCIIDSDNVFFRSFDASAYACGDQSPLYVDRGAIAADAPVHAIWTRNCDKLLGQPTTEFPADDYIGNAIVWDKRSVRSMIRAIEAASGRGWIEALCRTRAFSEYLLYGHFVRNSPAHSAAHRIVTESLTSAYWDQAPLDTAAIASMVERSAMTKVALCVASISNTPVTTIRSALGASRAVLA
jgi:Family of unknown function (DUF6492)